MKSHSTPPPRAAISRQGMREGLAGSDRVWQGLADDDIESRQPRYAVCLLDEQTRGAMCPRFLASTKYLCYY